MEQKGQRKAPTPAARKDRLKAALKSNMQKRKAQARARQKGDKTEAE